MTELVASGVPYRDTFWNIPMWARVFVYVGGTAADCRVRVGCWQRVSLWLKGKRSGAPIAFPSGSFSC
jgi:hypothetical protein